MNRDTTVWLTVALLSIGSLGVSATTIDSAMSTDANEVINLDYDRVPIGQDHAGRVLDEIEQPGGDSNDAPAGGSNSDASSGATAADASSSEGDPQQSQGSRDADQREANSEAESRGESEGNAARGGGSTNGGSGLGPDPSLLDRLLALLLALLRYALWLAVFLTAAALGYRYRDRIRALVASATASRSTAHDGNDARGAYDVPPSNAVDRAWAAMVARLDVDRPETTTPQEFATRAVESGFDREAVERLTRTFEEVHYGDRPVTRDRERVAKRSRRRLDDGRTLR